MRPAARPEKTFPQFVASFLINDLTRAAREECGSVEAATKLLPADVLGQLLALTHDGFIDRQQLRRIVKTALGRVMDDEAAIDCVCARKLIEWRQQTTH